MNMFEHKTKGKGSRMGWHNICECVKEEMSPMLSSAMKRIIEDKEEKAVETDDISEEGTEAVIKCLKKKRRIQTAEILYFQRLVQRARDYRDGNGEDKRC